jgi:hypothetical protein
MFINRRGLLIAGGSWLFGLEARAAAFRVPAGRSLGFAVIREGSRIGTHMLAFEGDPENPTIQVKVNLSVGIGPITLFRYRDDAIETWRAGQIFSIESETDADGKPYRMSALRGPDGLVVEGTGVARYVAPQNALPATHWNRELLEGPMINTQDGRLMRPKVTELGPEPIPTAAGAPIRADRFSLSGDATLDTWYDDGANWAGIRFLAGDKSEVRYVRI